jgi:GrpE
MFIENQLMIIFQLIKPPPCVSKPPSSGEMLLVSTNHILVTLLILTFTALIIGVAFLVFLLKTGRLRLVSSGKRGQAPTNHTFTYAAREAAPVVPLSANQSYAMEAQLPSISASQDTLQNKQWLALVREDVKLFEELDELVPNFDVARREVAQHIQSRLEEILARSGVEVILHDQVFDPHRHRAVSHAYIAMPNVPIVETVSPGFAVGRLVLRPALVHIASTENER